MTEPPFDPQRFTRTLYELVVLAALAGRTLHGYQIALDVAARSGGLFVLQHGTLYPILHRLEQRGLVRSAWSAEVGERRRRVYELTASGQQHLGAERTRTAAVFRRFLEAAGGGEHGQSHTS